jgi:septum formation protein
MPAPKIILASASPRRSQLLAQAEIEFTIQIADIDEQENYDLSIEEIPIDIARRKAEAIFQQQTDNNVIIIAADTVVVLNNQIIGKPTDEADALNILSKLSGNTHRVITGVAIIKEGQVNCFNDITEVSFHSLNESQIRHYVQQYKPYDKAGAYAIQEWIGVVGIKKINGCFYNVMGLPVSKVLAHL